MTIKIEIKIIAISKLLFSIMDYEQMVLEKLALLNDGTIPHKQPPGASFFSYEREIQA